MVYMFLHICCSLWFYNVQLYFVLKIGVILFMDVVIKGYVLYMDGHAMVLKHLVPVTFFCSKILAVMLWCRYKIIIFCCWLAALVEFYKHTTPSYLPVLMLGKGALSYHSFLFLVVTLCVTYLPPLRSTKVFCLHICVCMF